MFWNIVRLGGVGPDKTFEAALREMLPDANWDLLLSRSQAEKGEGFYRVAAGGRASEPRRARQQAAGDGHGGNEGAAEADMGEEDVEEEEVVDLREAEVGNGEEAGGAV